MSDDDFDFTQPQDKPKAAPPVAPVPPLAPFKPANSKYYDAAVADKFFRGSGKAEQFTAGTTLFIEGEKSGKQGLFGKRVIHRMYYLTDGEVALTSNGKPLDAIMPGEVVGEMAVFSEIPGTTNASSRSATATAKTNVSAFSLDGVEAQAGLSRMPDFALMLMSVMFERLRFVAARLAMRKGAKTPGATEAMVTFNNEMLKTLESHLERAMVLRFEPGSAIMREGDAGTTMYVILSGQVAVSIQGSFVEMAGKGATIGEMALVDQSARAATATAKTECKLLAVNRNGLIALVKSEPAIGMALVRSVAERLRKMNALLNS